MKTSRYMTLSGLMVRDFLASRMNLISYMSPPQVPAPPYHKFRIRGQATPLTEFAVYTMILAIDVSVGSSVRTICWAISKCVQLQSWRSLVARRTHTPTVTMTAETHHLHSAAEWRRRPTTLEVVLAPHLPYCAPGTQFGAYWWRCRMRFETTFAM